MISWILYIFLFILYEGEGYENDIYITIPQGTLLGVVEYTDELRSYNRWSGIPYASPPVGARRFRVSFCLIVHISYFVNPKYLGRIF